MAACCQGGELVSFLGRGTEPQNGQLEAVTAAGARAVKGNGWLAAGVHCTATLAPRLSVCQAWTDQVLHDAHAVDSRSD